MSPYMEQSINKIIVEIDHGLVDQWSPGVRGWSRQGMNVALKITAESLRNGTVENLDCGDVNYPSV